VTAEDEEFADQAVSGGKSPFAIINPGGGWTTKLWAPERFGQVADWLNRERGIKSIVTFGPGEERLAQLVATSSRSGGATPQPSTLKQFVALARRAELFIGGDTGPLHLAAACGTPIVGIYGPTAPERNGPFDPRDVTVGRDLWCREDCHKRSCWHWECMEISVGNREGDNTPPATANGLTPVRPALCRDIIMFEAHGTGNGRLRSNQSARGLCAVAAVVDRVPSSPPLDHSRQLSGRRGLGIRAWASGYLRKNLELTTAGPYAHTRNPLYLGTFFLGTGVALSTGALWFVAVFVAFYLLIYAPVMSAEAKTMGDLFPKEYEDYRRDVPLFLPRARPYRERLPRQFELSAYLRHREYQAAIGLVIVYALMAAKHLIFG
jgi:hypothetical protein